MDYDGAIKSEGMTQYFNVDVPFGMGYSCFIDCGAYVGDTFLELMNVEGCKTYIGFEPDNENFHKLSELIDGCQHGFDTVYLYPCAVSSKNEYLTFDVGMGASSRISNEGSEQAKQIVQAVSLDKVLKCQPTMIKMDIEGAEIDALYGARNIIQNWKCDLAICVYHKVSDLWEIPLLLHQWVPEYKFYLRCHHDATMETVLYVRRG